ncbi:hypothetical protein CVIRNUC_003912 [Coccomyxa viridis]|uniref:Uncharacterized protein n=1 Tax=Coccomyxa viridis TaxID=1274662 RepID=A0AAV1I160_9CHLO|nr:hypothetical protein CVIRNUC_003912 [Coccomyxa viridis]
MGSRERLETDEALETGGGLASLGRHSDAGTPNDPAWKHALRSFILFLASLITLLVLDAIWMKGIAPALGVDYFAVVKTIQNADVAWRPIGLIAYLIMGWAATFLAYNWVDSARIGLAIYGVFDFTSTFMYHGWTVKVAVLDCMWGTLLYALTGLVLQWLRPRLQEWL